MRAVRHKRQHSLIDNIRRLWILGHFGRRTHTKCLVGLNSNFLLFQGFCLYVFAVYVLIDGKALRVSFAIFHDRICSFGLNGAY